MIVLILVFSLVLADSCGEPQKEWQVCKEDRDCVVFDGHCGKKQTYNKRQILAVASYNRCLIEQTKCSSRGDNLPLKSYKAFCKNNSCVLKVNRDKKVTSPKNEVFLNQCLQDSDCRLMTLESCCTPTAVSKKSSSQYKEREKILLSGKCTRVKCAYIHQKAVCVKNQCETVRN